MPSLSEFIAHATQTLRAAGLDEPQREARALLAGMLDMDRAALLTQGERALSDNEHERLTTAHKRRAAGEPLARILGRKEFWGLNFALNAATLVPRPDSETLIAAALECFPDRQTPLRVLDLGTGSGCLLLSVLHEYPNAIGLGVDKASEAVAQAAANAATLGLALRSSFTVADWHQDDFVAKIIETSCSVAEPAILLSPPLVGGVRGGVRVESKSTDAFDLILSNPPYIASTVIPTLQREVREHDPALALDGGVDGLDAYRHISALLSTLLTQHGIAILEIGYDQGESVPALCRAAGFMPTLRHDLAGQPRCVIMTHTPAKDY